MQQFSSPEERDARDAALAEEGKQFCPKCCTAVELEGFAQTAQGQYGQYCRACKKAVNRESYLTKWKALKPAQHRQRTYGLEQAEYDRMMREQRHACGVCSVSFKGLDRRLIHVDHDHRTGVVRGLLCNRCNTGLAAFIDDMSLIVHAAAYVAKAETKYHETMQSLPPPAAG